MVVFLFSICIDAFSHFQADVRTDKLRPQMIDTISEAARDLLSWLFFEQLYQSNIRQLFLVIFTEAESKS